MKKVLTIATLALLALVACTKTPESFTLKVTDLPEALNGSEAYLALDGAQEPTDTLLVEESTITYTTDLASAQNGVLVVDQAYIKFAIESGEFVYQYVANEGAQPELKLTSAPEGSLNQNISKMQEEIATIRKDFESKYMEAMSATTEETEDAEGAEEAKRAQLEQIRNEWTSAVNEVAKKYYTGNEDNFVGLTAFQNIYFESDNEMIALYEQSGDYIKNNAEAKRRYEVAVAAQKTQVGASFVDYEIKNDLEELVPLSSFREEGKYLLVDFFASWCGPCKASMPILAQINKDNANILNTVSIALWDKAEPFHQAVEEHGITWHSIIDVESEGGKVYGISGVPTFLLFSPEGEILVRTHNPEEVQELLSTLR